MRYLTCFDDVSLCTAWQLHFISVFFWTCVAFATAALKSCSRFDLDHAALAPVWLVQR